MKRTKYIISNIKKENIIVAFILAVLFGFVFGSVFIARSASGFDYYATITIDHYKVYDDLSNFPLLFQGTYDGTAGEPDLRTTGNGGDIQNTVSTGSRSGAMTVPADLRFCADIDCSSVLGFEFELYDSTTGDITAWVEVPTMDASDDLVVYLAYGDSGTTTTTEDYTDLWGGYIAVWHMADYSTSLIADSSDQGNHLTKYSANQPIVSTGTIGYSQTFDGTDDYLVHDDRIETDWDSNWTIEIYSSVDTVTANKTLVSYGHSNVSPYYSWALKYIGANDTYQFSGYNGAWMNIISSAYESPVSNYVALVADTSDLSLYVDATMEDNETQGLDNRTDQYDSITVGADRKGLRDYFDGDIDEVRISTSAFSEEYIQTVNESFSPSTFYSVSGATSTTATATPTATATATATPTATPTATATATFTPTPTPPAILMGVSSITVPSGLEDAVESALGVYRPDSDLGLANSEMSNMWAISYYGESSVDDYYWVSVNGMTVEDTGDLDGWDLSRTLWSGMGVAKDNGDTTYTAHIEGSVGYSNMLATAGLADLTSPDSGGTGSATYYFPFPPGYVAMYGTKGIHQAYATGSQYGGLDWVAIDWVGGITYADNIFPNSVYVSQSGSVEWVCKDSVQTWVQIGDFLYGHLNDNETLEYGEYHSQGAYLGSLVPGPHDTNCGNMSQQTTSYHLHIGFKPSGDYFQWEDWVLTISDETFRRGNVSIRPGQYMLAEWASRPIVPTPRPSVTPGGPTVTPDSGEYYVPPSSDGGGGKASIWDGFLNGAQIMVQERVDMLNDPDYVPPDLPNEITLPFMMMSGVRIAIRSVYVLLKSNLNMTITLSVFFIILVLEPIRFLRALWIGIKEMVPFL